MESAAQQAADQAVEGAIAEFTDVVDERLSSAERQLGARIEDLGT